MGAIIEIERKAKGDCFEAATHLMLGLPKSTGAILVHGEALGRGKIVGVPHAHAWVEIGGVVLDFSNNKQIAVDCDVYYKLGEIRNTVNYSLSDMKIALLEHNTYGPWDDYLLNEIN